MRVVDDEYLLLSRTGRASPGMPARARAQSERIARQVELDRAARGARRGHREARPPVVITIPLPRAIHLVPRGRPPAGRSAGPKR